MTKDELAQKLKDAREARQATLQDAGRVLSIRAQVLQDLEDGRYEKLGALLYIKSYVRKYADYLKIDREEIESLLSRLEDPFKQEKNESLIRAQMNEQKRMVQRSFFKWYSVILAILLIVSIAVYFIYGEKVVDIFHVKSTPDKLYHHTEPTAVVAASNPVNPIVEVVQETEEDDAILAVNETMDEEVDNDAISDSVRPVLNQMIPTVDTRSALSEFEVDQIIKDGQATLLAAGALKSSEAADAVATDETVKQALAEGISTLSITLNNAECWLQIKDKNQKVLMNEVLPANAIYHIEGEAPFALHFGNARSIEKLVFNGEEVETARYRPTPKTTVSKIKLSPKEEN